MAAHKLDLGVKCFLLFAQLSGFQIDLRMTHCNSGPCHTTMFSRDVGAKRLSQVFALVVKITALLGGGDITYQAGWGQGEN